MIDTKALDTSKVERLFVISNTPVFLIEAIRKEPLARALSLRDDTELLECLDHATKQTPENVKEATLPFLLLAAISLKDPPAALLRSKIITPAACDPWFSFDYVRRFLIDRATTTKYSIWKQSVASPEDAPRSNTSYLILP